MPKVVGIKFKRNAKIYSFEAGGLDYKMNQGVIVETARGLEFGCVAALATEMDESKIVAPLKPVIRLADENDEKKAEELEAKRDETMEICQQQIDKSGLNMKLIDTEYTFDESKLIVHFSADGRVDFRELVKKLASVFRTRIELRQIGARDECRKIGGFGPCGQECCCSKHLSEYTHVSIKMAKNQNLSLNPAKISGLCGRLMCCLEYENPHYVETNKKMPKLNSLVTTETGAQGQVIGINQLKETVKLKIAEKEDFVFTELPLSAITFKGRESALDDVEKDMPIDDELKKLI